MSLFSALFCVLTCGVIIITAYIVILSGIEAVLVFCLPVWVISLIAGMTGGNSEIIVTLIFIIMIEAIAVDFLKEGEHHRVILMVGIILILVVITANDIHARTAKATRTEVIKEEVVYLTNIRIMNDNHLRATVRDDSYEHEQVFYFERVERGDGDPRIETRRTDIYGPAFLDSEKEIIIRTGTEWVFVR
ncbi:MAG: hypothetical protein Q4F60_03595 [Candidatus Saccharibacteria bacterium]|nr:hypothetical protein [Candidatus Saccharibacteria bacterium]